MSRVTPSRAALAAIALLLVPGATLAAPDARVASSAPIPQAVDTHAPLEGIRWHVRAYRAEDGGLAGVAADAWITLVDGSLTGTTGCGDLSGTYGLVGDALTVSDLSTAEPGCLDGDLVAQELAILGRLPAIDRYRFEGTDLRLEERGQDSLELHALVGPTWVPMYGGAEPMPEGIVSVRFGPGRIAGQGPCNPFGGSFRQDGASISIRPLESTRIACDDLDLEVALLTELQRARTYAFEAGDLVLLDDQGVPIRGFHEAATSY